ncbi:MAG: hypothetical protein CVT62_09430 [Actinobacteria bacterium HGW-Actinobacteria-2]|nr:MAG: hypothetical protein CVT62_09430 [Actinobacteria bacterium HGW-Actinobacteria-2]
MRNPKTLAWLYLIVGILGIVAGSFYLLVDLSRGGSWMLFDAAIVAMGVFGVVQGVRSFARLKQLDQATEADPPDLTSGP